MARFLVTLNDDRTEEIAGADAYQQEGPLTTFFAVDGERQVIDSWSTRLVSLRTADISAVRRVAESASVTPLHRGLADRSGCDRAPRDEALAEEPEATQDVHLSPHVLRSA